MSKKLKLSQRKLEPAELQKLKDAFYGDTKRLSLNKRIKRFQIKYNITTNK